MSLRQSEAVARIENAVRAHSPALLAYFVRRVEPSHEAADLLAETLLVLWRRAASLPAVDEEVRPWMFGIARNVLLHHYRASSRRRAIADRLRDLLSTTPHAGFDAASEHDELREALQTLEEIDRDIIGLVHWDGFSLVEASRILRMNESTVRSRYHRARARLRAALSPGPGELMDAAVPRATP